LIATPPGRLAASDLEFTTNSRIGAGLRVAKQGLLALLAGDLYFFFTAVLGHADRESTRRPPKFPPAA
jgi:hypothetical protein